ncbi:hypothetical protein P171DRAFT_231306 [Karstenula rhodostoma CBS 690.94]|uniref:Uncharacterized protein n=1 Tax=Karstenula rhodostoma CBS 690.94 TaxID=1392251 RepID=A0A9P4UFZ8_9PLEO|nr:hypothetical protein P171DRAFT_231306 [Karstenula rhodostoma CBS 690.94]
MRAECIQPAGRVLTPEGCPWPQRRSILRRRAGSFGRRGREPKGRACACAASLRRHPSSISANIPLGACLLATSLAPQLHHAGVAEGGGVWSAPVPERDASVPNFGCPTVRLRSLGCSAQTSQLELSRTVRVRLELTASPLEYCGRTAHQSPPEEKIFLDNISQLVAWIMLPLLLLARLFPYRYSGHREPSSLFRLCMDDGGPAAAPSRSHGAHDSTAR